jgi:ParB/RepB/Spo0J family partition protein
MVSINFSIMKEDAVIEKIAVSEIRERYGIYRIVNPRADAAMMKSMQKYGQLSPVVCVRVEDGYELIDGFKRLRAYRKLNKPMLRAKTMEMNGRVCKAAIIQFNRDGKAINEIEEALIIQSLYLEDGLTQEEIGAMLGRHKSWVSRRISLITGLSEEVREDIRLGLISVIAGRELRKLPRGNQKEAADAILKHRFSTRETAKLVSHLQSRPRWEYQAILYRPWEIIERKQPRPVGLEAKLISFAHVCRTVSEGVRKSRIESYLYEPIERAIGAAEDVVNTLKAAR